MQDSRLGEIYSMGARMVVLVEFVKDERLDRRRMNYLNISSPSACYSFVIIFILKNASLIPDRRSPLPSEVRRSLVTVVTLVNREFH
jgi:hypothetical protein